MIEKKNILIIDGPLGGGGAERVLIDILCNIDYSKYSVDLAVICKGGVLMDEVPEEVNVIELWRGYSLEYKLALRLSNWLHCNYLLSKKMNGKKLSKNYDLEISFLEGMPLKLGALRRSKSKKVTWVHADISKDMYEAGQFYPGEELDAYNKMDVVVNVSKDCENAFKRRFPTCRTDLRVIYNPIDKAKIVRMADAYQVKTDNKFLTVITVGRITPQKNPERLLQVAKLVHQAKLPVRFKWVGDGEMRSAMENLRDDMGLHEVVEFTGFAKNPFPHIKAADILLVTSDFEGFCLVICEALCLGVPVISTPTAGPSEIIGDNEYGILADFSPESIFKNLRKMVEDKEFRQKMAIKSLHRPDDYNVDKTIKEIEKLLR